jgi:tRNA threonylcarbamoyl adenosine modification protein YjeE
MSQPANPATWRLELPDETSTTNLAAKMASLVGQGDLVTLTGDLGAGKTTFARALIRHICGDPELETPSPSFTLMQIYESPKFPIVHADLYRVESAHELVELGWDEAAEGALVLVEWADRIGEGVDPDRLDIAFALDPARGDSYREVVLTGHGVMAGRLALARAIGKLLDEAGWADATRSFMLGDASVRAYERLEKTDGSRAILMISPARPDGPPVRFGKSYSVIARLAENIEPFVAIAQALRDKGLSAPQVYACDMEAGLAILEDLGHEGVLDENGAPILERYIDAASVLAFLHVSGTPNRAPLPGGKSYRIPPYDHDAMLIEVDLLPEWYAPHVAQLDLSASARAMFLTLWRNTLEGVARSRDAWVLRDYHSPNLIWLPERTGLTRIGIIDFQDCVMGHPAYDVASLLQDARVTVPDDMELRLLSHYAKARRAMDEDFDMSAFAAAYAILGAQRATKILGIFARLNVRDGKPHYMAHIPRVEHYLAKSLQHPALGDVKGWYKIHMPGILEA